MKVLLCHNFYQQSGGEDQVFADEGMLLASRGHHVIRYTMHNDSINGMGRFELAKNTLWNAESADALRKLMRRERPDVMHCTNTFPLISPSVYYVAKEEGVAVVQTLHNYRTLCPKAQFTRNDKPCELCLGKTIAWPAIFHACYRNDRAATSVVAAMLAYHRLKHTWTTTIDRYIALTKFVKTKHVEGGLPPDRIDIKPNFVCNDPGTGAGQGRYAVFVGRLSPEKGIETLVNAWRRLRNDLELRIVGQGPLANYVRNQCLTNHRIQWLGKRDLEEVLAIVGKATCLVMPSTWYETFGRTIIEAYAKGTPVVASRLGAMAELVSDGRTGYLFEPGNATDLAAKVERLVDETRALPRLRQQARTEFESKYTADANYEMLLSIYERALSGRPIPRTSAPDACEMSS